MAESRNKIDRRRVLIGKTISNVVAKAPWAWPLIKRPVGRFFNGIAPGWDERTGAGSVDHLSPLAAALTRVPSSPERVLDVGCGTGAGTFFLAREYPTARIRGLDLSEAMIAEANRKIGLDPEARIAFRVGDASKLPYPDQNFDLVAQINMPVFFSEIDRVLRPGGHVAITSTSGPSTPFYTPHDLIEKRLTRLGITTVATDTEGNGDWYLGRKEPSK